MLSLLWSALIFLALCCSYGYGQPRPFQSLRGTPQSLHGRTRQPTEEAKKIDLESRVPLEATRTLLKGKIGEELWRLIDELLGKGDIYGAQNDPCDNRARCTSTSAYRTNSGWCNNLKKPQFGSTHTTFRRVLRAAYDDGFNAPRSKGVNGQPLPSPRTVTTTAFGLASRESTDRTIWMMQWGQFLDHDISRTPNSVETNGSAPYCTHCNSATTNPLCIPIAIPANDPYFPASRGCMDFVRSSNGRLSLGPREQLNTLSAFLDASQVYGSDDCIAKSLRTMQDGDVRANENIALTSVQTLWLLEHNRIAKELKVINPSWNDEKLYQETRKIVIAMLQHITFKDYIPKVVGLDMANQYGIRPQSSDYWNGYDANVDATLTNEFSTAAYRFGHSLVQDQFELRKANVVNEKLDLIDVFSEPTRLFSANFLNYILSGMSGQASQTCDVQFSKTLRDRLYGSKNESFAGFDLPAFNIQRGRDHGIRPYVAYRQHFGLSVPKSFDDLKAFMDSATVDGLKKAYANVGDIDLFAGIVSEKPLTGAEVGPTAARIIADQFSRIKKGDRFWYELKSTQLFTAQQLAEIRKISLAKVICSHANIDIQPDVFLKPTVAGNAQRKCSSLSGINLNLWKA